MKTLEDFDRELGRGGEEMLEVPAWIAAEYDIFPEDVAGEEEDPGSRAGPLHQ